MGPNGLDRLGCSYLNIFRHHGNLSDLDKSIEYYSRAVALTPDGHPGISDRLACLGVAHADRFRCLGHLGDLEKWIECDSRAVALTPDGHPNISDRLATLGVSYANRFRRLEHMEDLEKWIDCDSRAVTLTPDGHPNLSDRLATLGVSYANRFRRLEHVEDLEKEIDCNSRALALTPDGHPGMSDRLATLGVSYNNRFRCLGQLEDLEKAIEYKSRALAFTLDGHSGMLDRLVSLGMSHTDRFGRLEHLEDLDKAIEYYSRALILTSGGHPDMPRRLTCLRSSYSDRFRRLGHIEDLEKTIECDSRALELIPEGHPDLPCRYFGHGLSCLSHYEHTGSVSYLNSSFSSFRAASQLSTGVPQDRFQYALRWAKLASQHTHPDIIDAYRTAIDLLPQFIWLGATPHQQYHDISTAETLASDAASAAIRSSDYSLALEWLEHARCVVWSQSLMLCSPLDQLPSSDSHLATQLKAIAVQFYNSTSSEIQVPSMTLEQIGHQRIRLASQYQSLLAQIRRLPEFEDFLQPVKANKLSRVARNGPVVVVKCNTDCCDALFIMPGWDTIRYLALPDFNEQKAHQARSDLEAPLRYMNLRERGVKFLGQPVHKDQIGSVLLTLWRDIVKPVLDYLGYLDDIPVESLPHITWCPAGTLSFLPLHAAGDYSQPRSRIFDYVISSYTPTVTALLASNSSSLDQGCPLRSLLTVGQATTPGHNPLPGTVPELAHVQAHTHNKAQYSQLVDDEATTTSVLDAMEHHDWVHLACHAHQNVTNPTKSGFYLRDDILDLASIVQEQRASLPVRLPDSHR
ncbi:unnamed protein product [Rhizoctonia solani]|uniref:CHAT domain-containing protein n=1 Tax=Rhizoctonia solani TaxID=456999 RepID=A0A8H3EE78_9AGAM|nr:unnamed protein product [Rhizoctonia solani]